MIWRMEKANISMQKVLSTRVDGLKTSNMAKVEKSGLMEVPITVPMNKDASMEMELSFGQMEQSMMAYGKTIKWMEKVNSAGLTAENMLVNTLMIKKKDKESTVGQMVVNMKEDSTTVNSMAKVFTH